MRMSPPWRLRAFVGVAASACLLLAVAPAVSLPGPAVRSTPSGPVAAAETDDPSGALVLVLDSSGSMKEPDRSGSTKIAAAKRALRAVVAELPRDALVGMRVYGATVFDKSSPGACRDTQLVVPIGPADKPALRREIGKYKPFGETPIAYSLTEAALDLSGPGRHTILLVSDGEETCDPSPCAAVRELRDTWVELSVHVVGMSLSGPARRQLQCIAAAGSGTYCESGNADELTSCLEHATLRAFRPFSLTGEPVQGALEATAAPQIGPGHYTDTLGGRADDDGTKYYSIEHEPGGTLHIGFTALPPSRGGPIGIKDAATLSLRTESGAACGSITALQTDAGVRGLLADGITVPSADSDPACAEAERLTLQVQRTDVAPAHGQTAFELIVEDERALADSTGLPAPAGSLPSAGRPVPRSAVQGTVSGGGAFADAATLRPGTWSDSLQPGEVLFYRVRADWGQAPAVTFRLGPDHRAGASLGTFGAAVNVNAYGPARHNLYVSPGRVNSLLATDMQQLSVRLPPVRYRNREATDLAGVSLAGYYYFSISLQDPGDRRFQVPMDVSVAVDGTPAGRPEYVEPEPVPPSPDETDPASDEYYEGPPTDADAEEGSDAGADQLTLTAAAGTIGGGVLLIGLAVVLRIRRTRLGDRHDSSAWPGA